ncbi:MAG: hypothetical protein NC181_01155 [Clostridium sp.]|nr:hypothetical protein [Clostridium sp.]MCM1444015.1 hypothetical protein [Candidatus Amulumruptor caecigallinarius]
MKEMLRSKGILLFIVAFIGVTYINAIGTVRIENSNYSNNYIDENIR